MTADEVANPHVRNNKDWASFALMGRFGQPHM
jgi:hypothetical protein